MPWCNLLDCWRINGAGGRAKWGVTIGERCIPDNYLDGFVTSLFVDFPVNRAVDSARSLLGFYSGRQAVSGPV